MFDTSFTTSQQSHPTQHHVRMPTGKKITLRYVISSASDPGICATVTTTTTFVTRVTTARSSSARFPRRTPQAMADPTRTRPTIHHRIDAPYNWPIVS